jgi:hypothetical protein
MIAVVAVLVVAGVVVVARNRARSRCRRRVHALPLPTHAGRTQARWECSQPWRPSVCPPPGQGHAHSGHLIETIYKGIGYMQLVEGIGKGNQ